MQGDAAPLSSPRHPHAQLADLRPRAVSGDHGVTSRPHARIITAHDKIVRPEQLRVARHAIRDYQGRGHSLRQTVERAEAWTAATRNYIAPQ